MIGGFIQTPPGKSAVDWEVHGGKKPVIGKSLPEKVVRVPYELHEIVFCHAVSAERRREYDLRMTGIRTRAKASGRIISGRRKSYLSGFQRHETKHE